MPVGPELRQTHNCPSVQNKVTDRESDLFILCDLAPCEFHFLLLP